MSPISLQKFQIYTLAIPPHFSLIIGLNCQERQSVVPCSVAMCFVAVHSVEMRSVAVHSMKRRSVTVGAVVLRSGKYIWSLYVLL